MRSRVLAALFVILLIAAAICTSLLRRSTPAQVASVSTQATVAGVPTNVVPSAQMRTNFQIQHFLFDDGSGYREVSALEFAPSIRTPSHDLIDFHAPPPAISLK